MFAAPLLLVTALSASMAFANGDEVRRAETNCPKGQVWDSQSQKCVMQTSRAVPDRPYRLRLQAGQGRSIRRSLGPARHPQTTEHCQSPQLSRLRHAKIGRTDEGIGYYLQSVKLDPQYAQVREYLGEAYVIKGRVDLAQEQLQQIKSICGTSCEEYQDLAEAINDSSKT
jgi:tetratricopeptide (TPR) repeat protein